MENRLNTIELLGISSSHNTLFWRNKIGHERVYAWDGRFAEIYTNGFVFGWRELRKAEKSRAPGE